MSDCLIDTNVLISAWLMPGGTADKAYHRSYNKPFETAVCQYSIDEMKSVVARKWPDRLDSLDLFLQQMFSKLKIVPTATVSDPKRFEIRDIDDAPIMAAALDEDVDMIITGDRDFFSGGYVFPFAVTPARFAAIDEWMMEEEIEWPPAPFLDS